MFWLITSLLLLILILIIFPELIELIRIVAAWILFILVVALIVLLPFCVVLFLIYRTGKYTLTDSILITLICFIGLFFLPDTSKKEQSDNQESEKANNLEEKKDK